MSLIPDHLVCSVCDGYTYPGCKLNSRCRCNDADVKVYDQGSIVQFEPVSPEAKRWWEASVEDEGWQWLGNRCGVDRRMAQAIMVGLQHAQFQIEVQ